MDWQRIFLTAAVCDSAAVNRQKMREVLEFHAQNAAKWTQVGWEQQPFCLCVIFRAQHTWEHTSLQGRTSGKTIFDNHSCVYGTASPPRTGATTCRGPGGRRAALRPIPSITRPKAPEQDHSGHRDTDRQPSPVYRRPQWCSSFRTSTLQPEAFLFRPPKESQLAGYSRWKLLNDLETTANRECPYSLIFTELRAQVQASCISHNNPAADSPLKSTSKTRP